MAEYNRQDLFSDELMQAPLQLNKDMEVLVATMEKLSDRAKQYEKNIAGGTSVNKMKVDTDALVQAQIELDKIQRQMITVQAKSTEEYISQADALKKLKEEQKDKTALGDRDAKTVSRQNASHRTLEAALAKNKRAYKELGDEQKRNSKEGQELLKIIQSQDKEIKELSGSIGEHQKNVGAYKDAILEALEPINHFEKALGPIGSGLRGTTLAMQGAAKGANILKVAMLAIPLFALIGAITALITYFQKTEDGAQKLRLIMAYVEEAFSGVVDVVIALGRWLSELSIDKVKQGFKDFGDTIKNYVVSRIELLLKGLNGIGDAFSSLWEGEFKQAAKQAGQAFMDITRATNPVVMGIEAIVDGTKAATEAVGQWAKGVHAEAMTAVELQKVENRLIQDRRAWMVEEERLQIRLNALREKAADQRETDQERLDAMREALVVMDKLEAGRLAHAIKERDIAVSRAAMGEKDEATLMHIAELEKQILGIQATRLQEGRKLVGQMSALEEKMYQDILTARDKIRKRSEQDLTDAIKQAKEQTRVQMAELQIRLDQEAEMIQASVLNGTLTRKEGDKLLEKARKDHAVRLIQENIKQLEQELQNVIKYNAQKLLITGQTEEERARILTESATEEQLLSEQIAKMQMKLTDTVYNNMEAWHSESLANTEIFLENLLMQFDEGVNAIGSLFMTLTENRIADIEREQEAFESQADRELEILERRQEGYDKSKEHELALFEAVEGRKSEIENEAARRSEEFERRKIQQQRKQAIFDKAVSAAQAGIAGALAAVKALQTPPAPNVFAAGLAATLTAIQVGAILAKQIPQYEKGGVHYGGLLIAGEKGSELKIGPTGNVSLTPGVPTLMHEPAGTVFVPHDETMRILARSGMSVSDYNPRSPNLANELDKHFRTLNYTISNKREVHYNWTRRGLEKAFKNGESRNYFMNEFYR
jgi:hypothetical protein